MNQATIPVFSSPNVRAWPGHEDGAKARYLTVEDTLTHSFTTDAHFSAYSAPTIERRLDSNALSRPEFAEGLPMVLLVVDVDDPQAHQEKTSARPEWRTQERAKVEKLFAEHPGGFSYDSRGGYRLLYRSSFVLQGEESPKQWRRFYYNALCYLYKNFGIEGDPSCSDWTRFYRCPHATREDSDAPEFRATLGDPTSLQIFEAPHLSDKEALEASYELSEPADPKNLWNRIVNFFKPKPEKKAAEKAPKETQPPGREMSGTFIRPYRLWGLAALQNETEQLKKVTEGGRTPALFHAALRLFGIAKAGPLSREEVEERLREACKANGWLLEYQDFARQVGNAWRIATARDLTHLKTSEPDTPKHASLMRGKKGAPVGGIINVIRIATQDANYAGAWAIDTFSSRILLQRSIPGSPTKAGEQLDRDDLVRFRAYCTETYGLIVNKDDARAAIYTAAKEAKYSSALRWMEVLPAWDGVPRLDGWLSVYLYAEDTQYTRMIGSWWLLQAVARIYKPGEQTDGTLILEGLEQGEGKSSLAFALVPDPKWACDQPLDSTRAKETGEILQGKLIVELAELTAFRRADIETIKAFLTQRSDDYRPPWGETAYPHPRQCIFLGTTNNERYLKDDSSNRRFWPVRVEFLDREALVRDRDQLWAEARYRYLQGEKWWPQTEEQKKLLRTVTHERRVIDESFVETIEAYLRNPHEKRTKVCVTEVLTEALRVEPNRFEQKLFERASQALKELGWQRSEKQSRYKGKVTRLYHAPEGWEYFRE